MNPELNSRRDLLCKWLTISLPFERIADWRDVVVDSLRPPAGKITTAMRDAATPSYQAISSLMAMLSSVLVYNPSQRPTARELQARYK